MSNNRIVIRAFTRKRDIGAACLISGLLEKLGHKVMIACSRDFEFILRYWRPQLVLVNTVGQSEKVKKINKNIKTVFLDSEGFVIEEENAATRFSQLINAYRSVDNIFVWGNFIKSDYEKILPKENLNKILISGNPVLDLIKFRPKENNEKKSIGFAMRHGLLNNYKFDNSIRTLGVPIFDHLDRTLEAVKSFPALIECMKLILKKTNYKVSIRPHPREKTKTYVDNIVLWLGEENAHRVEVDDGSVYIDWASKQKFITTPTTTSILENYLLKIPVINIRKIAGIDDVIPHQDEMENALQSLGFVPETYDDYIKLVNKNLNIKKNKKVDKLLKLYCHFDINDNFSSCLSVAKNIDKILKNTKSYNTIFVPKFVLEIKDSISYRKLEKLNQAYPDFNYYKGIHKGPENLDHIINSILSVKKI